MLNRQTLRRLLAVTAGAVLSFGITACGSKNPSPAVDEGPSRTTQTDRTQQERERQEQERARQEQERARQEQERASQRTATRSAVGSDQVASYLYLPTGDEGSSVILIESIAPAAVQAGVPFDYKIIATNLTKEYELRNVIVTQEVPGTYTIRSSDQTMQPLTDQPMSDNMELLSFYVGELGPGQAKTINVNALSNEEGRLEVCTTATYDMFVCWATNVVKPNVSVTKSGPSEVTICDPINYEITVRNEGSGVAKNLVLTDQLPEGLQTQDGQRVIRREIGDLGAGKTWSETVTVTPQSTGQYVNVADVAGEGVVAVSNPVTTSVRQPVLEVTKTAPEADFLNARFDYRMTVTNSGDTVARNVKVTDTLPSGAEFISATEGGQQTGNTVTWNVGDLQPGQTRNFGINVRAKEKGILRNEVVATADCANTDNATASALTEIVGIPALVLEVIDEEDPIKVGQEVVYRISVRNQGSEAVTNLALDAVMENQSFVSSEGPTQASAEGELIKIAPHAKLDIGEEVIWRLRIKAEAAGDVRFRVNMVADQVERPVRETESTNQYVEGRVR